MKIFKRIAAAAAALVLLSSCSILGGNSSPAASGNSTGSALKDLYTILKNTGLIDLGDLGNLINLGTILTGANSLTNAGTAYVEEFAQGLISGSSNLVNNTNVNAVISGLKSLAGMDTSSLSRAAASVPRLWKMPSSSRNSAGIV